MPKSSVSKNSLLNRLQFDSALLHQYRCTVLVGLDEVGRGSLIGPVVAGAVWLPAALTEQADWQAQASLLNDSKALSAAQRNQLSALLWSQAVCAIGVASQAEIVTLNVFHAAKLAMQRAAQGALEQLPESASAAVLLATDGKAVVTVDTLPGVAVVRGDAQSAAIAAGSIIAKVWRDAWVCEQAEHYPHYGWQRNMGYATAQHRAALAQLGPTPLHRQNWRLTGS